MAQQHTVSYVSDLSGKAIENNDAPTVKFGWDGTNYEVDLTADEAEKFYKAVEKYLSVSRKTGKASTSTKARSNGTKSNAAEVREWAKSNGYDVPDRGRIPANVREAWEAK